MELNIGVGNSPRKIFDAITALNTNGVITSK